MQEIGDNKRESLCTPVDGNRATNDVGWEFDRKHIFILSAAGKPIYSRYGDEQDLVTTFGLLQAVISIAIDSGDEIRCIMAGERRIVYFIKKAIYFICISSTNEPELMLIKQLQFMYSQILLVLTSKVQHVFRNNPSADLRQLLGSDTTRLMHAACVSELVPTCIAFESVSSFVCPKDIRDDIGHILKTCVEGSGAAVGIVLFKDRMVNMYSNASMSLQLTTSDIVLLSHFVANSSSFRSNEQHWVPICMPDFNANGYLQAYISNIGVSGQDLTRREDFTLILVAASADSDTFKDLHRGRRGFEQQLIVPSIAGRLLQAALNQARVIEKFKGPANALHYMYKFRPKATAKSRANLLPAQIVESEMSFPLSESSATRDSIMTHYQRLAICVRCGSSTPECTLFLPVIDSSSTTAQSSRRGILGSSSPSAETDTRGSTCDMFASNSVPKWNTPTKRSGGGDIIRIGSGAQLSHFDSSLPGEDAKATDSGDATAAAVSSTAALSVLSGPPSSDHALAYTVLSSGYVVVALATYNAELYITFPCPMSPLDACTITDSLLRTELDAAAASLFQIAQI